MGAKQSYAGIRAAIASSFGLLAGGCASWQPSYLTGPQIIQDYVVTSAPNTETQALTYDDYLDFAQKLSDRDMVSISIWAARETEQGNTVPPFLLCALYAENESRLQKLPDSVQEISLFSELLHFNRMSGDNLTSFGQFLEYMQSMPDALSKQTALAAQQDMSRTVLMQSTISLFGRHYLELAGLALRRYGEWEKIGIFDDLDVMDLVAVYMASSSGQSMPERLLGRERPFRLPACYYPAIVHGISCFSLNAFEHARDMRLPFAGWTHPAGQTAAEALQKPPGFIFGMTQLDSFIPDGAPTYRYIIRGEKDNVCIVASDHVLSEAEHAQILQNAGQIPGARTSYYYIPSLYETMDEIAVIQRARLQAEANLRAALATPELAAEMQYIVIPVAKEAPPPSVPQQTLPEQILTSRVLTR